MRVSTSQIYNNSLNQMQNSQAKLAEIQEKISSGKAILRPSDDPVAAARILKLDRELARTEVFESNINASTRRLSLEEITLEQIDNAATRVRELTLQANSTVLSDADRTYIAEEIRQLQDSVFSLMNTKDADGEYLFAGSQGKTQPFVKNGDNSYSYVADDGQRYIQAGPELQVATTDSGRDAFMVLEDPLTVSVLGQDSSLITTPTFTDEEGDTFKAYSEEHGDILIQVRKPTGAVAGDYEYTITNSNGDVLTGTSPAVTLSDVAFNTLDTVEDTVIVGGLTFDLGSLSVDSIEVIKEPAGVSSNRVVSAEQVLDSTAYLAFVEAFGSDINVAMTIGTNAGDVEYDYSITDLAGGALPVGYTVTPAGPITEPTQVTINNGVTDFLTFTLTPLTNALDPTLDLVTTDEDVTIAVANNGLSYLTGSAITDSSASDYSDFAAANGNVSLVFRNNGGTLEYDIQDGTSTSVIGGYASVPAGGTINVPEMGIDISVDDTALAAGLPNPGDTTVGGGEIALRAQVNTVLSGEAQVSLRAEEGRHSLLQTMNDLITALETPSAELNAGEFSEAMATALLELDESKEANLNIRTAIGARVNSLEAAAEVNADYKLFTETALSLLQDLDYATAISEFSLQETALSAAQATFSRVTSLSLFNYL